MRNKASGRATGCGRSLERLVVPASLRSHYTVLICYPAFGLKRHAPLVPSTGDMQNSGFGVF